MVTEKEYTNEELLSTNTEKNNYKYENVASSNALVTLNYSQKLAKQLWLKGGVYYGLTDLYKTVNGKQNSIGINLSLSYGIFDK